MSENYIKNHFFDIKKYANVIEKRLDDSYCTIESVLQDNNRYLKMCQKYNYNYILIDDNYQIDINLYEELRYVRTRTLGKIYLDKQY